MQLGRVAEIFLGQPEIVGTIMLLGEVHGVVRIIAEQTRLVGGRHTERRRCLLRGYVIGRRSGGESVRARRTSCDLPMVTLTMAVWVLPLIWMTRSCA